MNRDLGEMSEICKILSPRPDSMLSSCFFTTSRRVLAQKVGFQTVWWQGTRQRLVEHPLIRRTVKRRPYIARSAADINSRSCGRGTANAAAEMAYINVSAVLASSNALLSAGVFIINYY